MGRGSVASFGEEKYRLAGMKLRIKLSFQKLNIFCSDEIYIFNLKFDYMDKYIRK
jgi:hypothetical protein